MLVLIGVAAAFRTAFLPHMTKPSVASNHPVAVPPQWLPVLLASSPTSLPLPPPSPPPSPENPVHTLGLAARQNAEMCFVASLEKYVPPGSRYEGTVWNNGTHDLCPYLFSKTLEHDRVTSFPLCSHVDKIIEAVSAPPEAKMFNAIRQAPGSVRKLESPQSSWDSMLMTSPATTTATATKVTDPEFGFEIAEVFAMALLRDKPFATWADDDAEVQKVVNLLNTYPQRSSAPLEGGLITANTLMRGAGADETIG